MRREEGYALFFTLIIILSLAMIMPMMFRMVLNNSQAAINYSNQIKEEYLIRGICQIAIHDLKEVLQGKISDNSYIDKEMLDSSLQERDLSINYKGQEIFATYKILSVVDESSKLNLKSATKNMLESLNNIGDKLAEKISDKEEFLAIEEITQIEGIGEIEGSTYDNLKDYITVSSDGRININTAPLKVLDSLKGIGEDLASKIIAERRFLEKKDLKDVAGIGKGKYDDLKDLIKVSSESFKAKIMIDIPDYNLKEEVNRFIKI